MRRLDYLLARLIANTRRVRRGEDILTVAGYMREATAIVGGLTALAQRIGISEEMIREFMSAERLSEPVKALVRSRRIDSVDVVYRTSRLPIADQLPVAAAFVSGELSSNDVRAVASFSSSTGSRDITHAIDRVKASRNVREYVAEFLLPASDMEPSQARRGLVQGLGARNIRSLEISGRVVRLVTNREGMLRLQTLARERKTTKRAALKKLACGGGL